MKTKSLCDMNPTRCASSNASEFSLTRPAGTFSHPMGEGQAEGRFSGSAAQRATTFCREPLSVDLPSESGSKLHALQTLAGSCCALPPREAFGVRPACRRFGFRSPRRELLQGILSTNRTAVGTSRCDVPAREAAGGTVAPLNAARTAQRVVPTRFRALGREVSFGRVLFLPLVLAATLTLSTHATFTQPWQTVDDSEYGDG